MHAVFFVSDRYAIIGDRCVTDLEGRYMRRLSCAKGLLFVVFRVDKETCSVLFSFC